CAAEGEGDAVGDDADAGLAELEEWGGDGVGVDVLGDDFDEAEVGAAFDVEGELGTPADADAEDIFRSGHCRIRLIASSQQPKKMQPRRHGDTEARLKSETDCYHEGTKTRRKMQKRVKPRISR